MPTKAKTIAIMAMPFVIRFVIAFPSSEPLQMPCSRSRLWTCAGRVRFLRCPPYRPRAKKSRAWPSPSPVASKSRCCFSDVLPLVWHLCSWAIRLLTPVRMQTRCQRPRAAGVLVFHHVGQHMPHAVVGACEALGTRRERRSRAHRRAPPYYWRRSASRTTRCDDIVSPANMSAAPRCAARPLVGCPASLDQLTPSAQFIAVCSA
jgi:hypothetical protein